MIIGIDRWLLKAFIIAIVDILPLLGSGIVLVPWGLLELALGVDTGSQILVLYIILLVVKQVLEAKIVGSSIGVRPIYTFFAMILGTIFLGPFGIFLGPFLLIVANSIYKNINRDKRRGEYEQDIGNRI